MAEKGFKRKLTSILNAYDEGSGRLMGEEEGSTVRTLTAYLTSTSFKLLNH